MNVLAYPALGETVYEDSLPNGLRILTVKKPGFHKTFAMFAVRYGGADRRFRLGDDWIDTPAGVAHFLEHKMFDMPDGSNVLSELSARGASPNAYTGADMTAYHITCTDGFYDSLEILLRYVSTPWYTAESVAKEQGIIGQEIRMYENAPSSVGYYGLMGILYACHPVRETVAGTVESIARITPETLYDCYKAFYNPSNMVLCCVGDAEPDAVAEMARRILPAGTSPAPERDYGPEESLFPTERRIRKTMAVSAPQFFLGAKLPGGGGAEGLRRQLLGELSLEYLTGSASAFYTDLYSKGLLGRDFGSEIDSAADTMTLLAAGESKDPEAVCAALLERVSLIARRGVDAAAFERCRRARYGAELGGLDAFAAYARALVRGAFRGWRPADVFPLLESFTPEDAAGFLCENLTEQRIAMSVTAASE